MQSTGIECSPRYVGLTCPQCGILFLVPAPFAEYKMLKARQVFCPNGHGVDIEPGEPQAKCN